MLRHRVIPCLLLQDGGLVKTTRFKNPKYIGDPINAIRIFNEKEVDELMVLDIDASKLRRAPDFELIEQFASECFTPLCYGGGVRSVEDAKRLFSVGVEKICIQTSILDDFDLIRDIADRYGSQSLVVSIDVKKNIFGQYKMHASATGRNLDISWQQFRDDVVRAGAGEVMVVAVDRDGTLNGLDLALIEDAANNCPIPLIVAGGACSLDDLKAAVDAGASAIAAGALFVYHGPHRAVLITYPKYSELENLLDY